MAGAVLFPRNRSSAQARLGLEPERTSLLREPGNFRVDTAPNEEAAKSEKLRCGKTNAVPQNFEPVLEFVAADVSPR